MLTFGSLFAGIGGFDAGFEESGMRCRWQVEIDPQARRVLEKHWPNVERHEDVRKCGKRNLARVDVICGGFPCQDLSVAGKRGGIKANRSGLFYEMTRIIDELRPEVVVWENVPGLLSNDGGRSAALVLWEFARMRFHGGWRVLDSQYFGVAQRRDRVFGVFARGRAGAERAAEILALTQSGGGHHPPLKGARQADQAATLRSRSHSAGVSAPGRGGKDDQNLIAGTLQAHSKEHGHAMTTQQAAECGQLVASPIAASMAKGNTGDSLTGPGPRNLIVGFAQNQRDEIRTMDKAGALASEPGMKQQTYVLQSHHGRNCPDDPLLVIPIDMRQASRGEKMTNNRREGSSGGAPGTGIGKPGDPAPTIASTHTPAIAFTLKSAHRGINNAWQYSYPHTDDGVRRLMPVECLRLQGFPDDWLDLEPALSDSAKYRLIGNAVTRTVAAWLGRRVAKVLGN